MVKITRKRNIIQDVVPTKRSIRNIELPSRGSRIEKIEQNKISIPSPIVKIETLNLNRNKPPTISDISSYKYEYDEPKKSYKKLLLISVFLFVLVISFGISTLFKSAKIQITPKHEVKILNEIFTAKKDAIEGNLNFQSVTVSKNVEKIVEATGEQNVEQKAKGTIVIYNNTAKSQKLIATTRFQTPEGLVFNLISQVVVPSKQIKDGKTVSGSIEALVEASIAGEKYNISLKDFTIPGFKGGPKYTQIYARSKTEMIGGFVGIKKIVSKEVLDKVSIELEASLKDSLSRDIISQIPSNFILYPNSVSYSFDQITQANSSAGNIIIQRKGLAKTIIFEKGILSRSVISVVAPTLLNDMVKISNLETMDFSYTNGTSSHSSINTTITFSLKGDANIVWVFDENKLKSDLLGLSKKNADTIIAAYSSIAEAWIVTRPFWNQTIPLDPNKVSLVNTESTGLTE